MPAVDLENGSSRADKVLYHGHAVAAVAARSQRIADEALAAIEVEYEVLPPVLIVATRCAERAAAPRRRAATKTSSRACSSRRTSASEHRAHMRIRWASATSTRASRKPTIVVEREFSTRMVHQGYIEPHNAVAHYNADGQVTIWTSTQGAFGIRQNVARILNIPLGDLRVIPMEIGGGFGAKNVVYLEPVAALLSKKSGHPVKMWMSARGRHPKATGPTSATHIQVKIGAKKDGTLTAVEADMAYEAGAFPGSPVGAGARCALLRPTTSPNQRIDGFDVVTNNPKTRPTAPPAPRPPSSPSRRPRRAGRAAEDGPDGPSA